MFRQKGTSVVVWVVSTIAAIVLLACRRSQGILFGEVETTMLVTIVWYSGCTVLLIVLGLISEDFAQYTNICLMVWRSWVCLRDIALMGQTEAKPYLCLLLLVFFVLNILVVRYVTHMEYEREKYADEKEETIKNLRKHLDKMLDEEDWDSYYSLFSAAFKKEFNKRVRKEFAELSDEEFEATMNEVFEDTIEENEEDVAGIGWRLAEILCNVAIPATLVAVHVHI